MNKNRNLFYKAVRWYFNQKALPHWAMLFLDALVVFVSAFMCHLIEMGPFETFTSFYPLCLTLLVYVAVYVVGFMLMGTYRGVMRYSTISDLYRIGVANIISVLIIAFSRFLLKLDDIFVVIRLRELIYTYLISTFAMCVLRAIVKRLYEKIEGKSTTIPIFIYGVKTGGISIAKSVSNGARNFVLKGFISDADDMSGKMLMGVNVYKNDDTLVSHMKSQGVKALLISPLKRDAFANNPTMADRLISAGITVYTMGSAQEWDGKSDINASQLREIQIEDLLHREEIDVDMKSIEQLLRGKRVFITGSAGSIGSEMVRQIAKFDSEQLILIDEAETPQHDIRLMLKKQFPHVKAESIVTSITKHRRMESLFKMYRPDYVFHAAAYKHVPMMEDNPSEAVHNNIDGTRVIADLSVKYGVKKFVMVSTDKAVNPTNVMGCSKRICEIYVQSLDKAIKDGKVEGITQFVTTRFGNVLGSNGSVIPLFREQIKNGGPITVTHPDIVRFFMLIPEACKLVLEAGTMGKGGEIFVFDMGKPVKIVDLAKRMINLSGAEGIEIKFTGLRDGEKLYEEVLNDEEITKPTFNKKIKIAQVREYDYEDVCKDLDNLLSVSYLYDDMNTVAEMKKIVPEYKSQHSKYESLDK